jgi:heat shock protein HtpX
MWAIAKRVFLFIVVNMLIMLTLTIAFNVISQFFGISWAGNSTIYIFYTFMGFGGALIGLAISRQMAKWSMGVKVIDPQVHDPQLRQLVMTVHQLAQKAGLRKMPEVGIYDSPEVNAFATGPTKSRSLVAVSTGLLQQMDKDAVEGVLGHEIAHIANGDMVTMTLLQGLINTMVLIAARVVSSVIASQFEERSRYTIQMVLFYVLQIVLSLLGSLVVCRFSRWREFRADRGGAALAGRQRMLAGLKSLRNVYGAVDESQPSVASLKISGRSASSFAALFSTHPPLEARIRRLEAMSL